MTDTLNAGSWVALAACRDRNPEIFFPDSMKNAGPAKRVCANCPVALECFRFALSTRQRWGVWAGTTPKQRAALRKLAAGKPGTRAKESGS